MDNETKVEIERLHDEDKRQNHRLEQLEENIKVIQELTLSVHTLVQTFIATIDTAAVMGGVNWQMVASASALAGILSVTTSIAEVTAE